MKYKTPCSNIWGHETKDFHHGYNLKQKGAQHNITIDSEQIIRNKQVDLPRKDLDPASPSKENDYNNDSNIKQKVSVQDITVGEKIIDSKIVNKDTHFSTPVQLVTDASSGNLVIELNEEIIDMIDKKTANDPNLITILKKTDSGKLVIDFNPVGKAEGYACKISDKRTPSGHRLLKVKKDFVNLLTSKNAMKVQETKPKITENDPKFENRLVNHEFHINHQKVNNQTEKTQILNEMLLQMEQKNEQNRLIKVKLEKDAQIYSEIEATLAKTLSGNIAVDITELAIRDKVMLNRKERDVIVSRSNSGAIILNLNEDGGSPNAILKAFDSGACLLVLVNANNAADSVKSSKTPVEKFYKMRIKTANLDIPKPPAVLKTTLSQTFIVIPDKEFHVSYKHAIQDLLEDNTEYFGNIMRTNSGRYVLSFDDTVVKPNALIVKDESGDVYITKLRESLITVIERRKTSVEITSKVIDELLLKLPRKSIEDKRDSTLPERLSIKSKNVISKSKSSNNLDLYEKVKLFLPDHKNLSINSSQIFKQTDSGEYAVILDKDSKITFMKNLKNYLKSKSKIPIKETNTGEFSMVLNSDRMDNNHCEVLKITPSGNIYIIVNDKFVKDMTKKPIDMGTITASTSYTKPKLLPLKNEKPVNKAVTTTCNSKPGDCNLSKCVCSKIKFNNVDWVFGSSQNDKNVLFKPSVFKMKNNPDGSFEICDANKYTEECTTSKYTCPNSFIEKALPHIVIKPCDCQTMLTKNSQTNEQCFYVLEVVCPYENNIRSKSTDCEVEEKINEKSNWDSLQYLPPQLPNFLQDFKY